MFLSLPLETLRILRMIKVKSYALQSEGRVGYPTAVPYQTILVVFSLEFQPKEDKPRTG